MRQTTVKKNVAILASITLLALAKGATSMASIFPAMIEATEFIYEKGIQFVRIDGSTLARDRQTAVENFRLSYEVKIAIIGITVGGVGLDFSAVQNVVFLELPKSASEMLQFPCNMCVPREATR